MQARHRQLLIVCGAIGLSLLMVNVVFTFLYLSRPLPGSDVPQALPLVLFSLGLVFLGAAPAVKRSIFKRADAEGFDGNPEGRFAAYQTATIVAFAMREAAGLLGFVLAILTGNPWWSWGLGGVALVAMVLDRPRPETLG
ncbi:MAG TPA: hypothetical protein VKK31_11965 [Thermoanaerobaculia bacterium]|nr:hypothetical protein [Thermoanaerobaculia bacterium]